MSVLLCRRPQQTTTDHRPETNPLQTTRRIRSNLQQRIGRDGTEAAAGVCFSCLSEFFTRRFFKCSCYLRAVFVLRL